MLQVSLPTHRMMDLVIENLIQWIIYTQYVHCSLSILLVQIIPIPYIVNHIYKTIDKAQIFIHLSFEFGSSKSINTYLGFKMVWYQANFQSLNTYLLNRLYTNFMIILFCLYKTGFVYKITTYLQWIKNGYQMCILKISDVQI